MLIDGININYLDEGTGDAVLILHGWGANIDAVMPIISHALNLGKRAIAIDLPGHGKSDETTGAWSVNEYAALVLKLMENLQIESWDMVGHSFGGRVAIVISANHPAKIKRVILCDSAGIIPKRSMKYYFKIYTYKLAKQLARIKFLNKLFHISERGKKAGSEEYKLLSENMKGTYVRVVNQDLRPLLSSIKAPVLLVWGSLDLATPMRDAYIMEKEISGSGLVVFEGAGHFAYLDDLPKFYAIMTSFLGGK